MCLTDNFRHKMGRHLHTKFNRKSITIETKPISDVTRRPSFAVSKDVLPSGGTYVNQLTLLFGVHSNQTDALCQQPSTKCWSDHWKQ